VGESLTATLFGMAFDGQDEATHGHPPLDLSALIARQVAAEGPQLLDLVRERLAVRLEGDASLGRVAEDLGLSSRTLQRHLCARGASFQELLEEVRRARAITLLIQGPDAIDRIAARLGYGDASNFRRAFRRWMGVSPTAFRAAHRERSDAEAGVEEHARVELAAV
jgi:AraC-like DNA-binding protein